MESGGEYKAVNALINAVDADIKTFKQKQIKEYSKEYYSKPVNKQRRNKYNKKYQQMLKLKQFKG